MIAKRWMAPLKKDHNNNKTRKKNWQKKEGGRNGLEMKSKRKIKFKEAIKWEYKSCAFHLTLPIQLQLSQFCCFVSKTKKCKQRNITFFLMFCWWREAINREVLRPQHKTTFMFSSIKIYNFSPYRLSVTLFARRG